MKNSEPSEQRIAYEQFIMARAEAINEYADLESSLGMLFSTLLRTDMQRGFVAFSSVLNPRARTSAIGKLLNLSYSTEYDIFWASMTEKLGGIDDLRNKIAHWIVMTSHSGEQPFHPSNIQLHAHPNIFDTRTLHKKDIENFTRRAKFYKQLAHSFMVHLKVPMVRQHPERTSWQEIFAQRVTYPPDPKHPLYPFQE